MRHINTLLTLLGGLCFAATATAAQVEPDTSVTKNPASLTALQCLAQAGDLPSATTQAPETDTNSTTTEARRTTLLERIDSHRRTATIAAPTGAAGSPADWQPAATNGLQLVDFSPLISEPPVPIPTPGVMPAGFAFLAGLAVLRRLRRKS